MDKVYKDSLKLHKKFHGKLELKSKVPIKNKADLSLAYTPGVAQVCREIGKDKSLAREYTIKKNTVAVISDGSAILGLGNLGPEAAIPVMEGKAVLFKEFGGVDAFPICLDTQDTEEIIKTVKYLAPVFGGINLEDISAPRCFEIEERLKKEMSIPVMHDDQHGTAVVVLAAMINALKIKRLDKSKAKVVISGAGAAGTAVAKILMNYGFKNVSVCDSKGLIYKERGDLNNAKLDLAILTGASAVPDISLKGVLKNTDVFIGVSGPNIITRAEVKSMNAKPIILVLANPVPEIMPDEARAGGAFIIGTGRSDFPNQINNVLAFPGIFRGALDNKVTQITEEMLVKAAKNLANYVKKPSRENILPKPFDKGVAKAVAKAIR
ncbi:MAG: malate dehydrogenase [Candidatus Magasanikbacteria bacterium RIFOXYD2_FULL_39_9]|uniref:Malate dehydrogenase n=1 Tax=Candidatus Magasanikbacteria bacterium RIFOXYD1_FULL_40_23 TaxID=1798705 RepID=A0A1F6P8U8_9BACT|nr:MAG: malate dehydrogenase [Candidatus Magasanikbacteria bacterium RIFOXYD1_FULL_40_23]OGH93562.1 MAG: malate dehydrogenase [Candidatus Magasanikbacteria bacterium RIFOXYD2_FULL_39_9]